jgi:hypothetical protein
MSPVEGRPISKAAKSGSPSASPLPRWIPSPPKLRAAADRRFLHAIKLGHDAQMMPPAYVKPIVGWMNFCPIQNQTLKSLAVREGKTARSIRMTLPLAFLALDIVKAAVEGRLPRGYGLKRLVDLPMAWADQWRALGLQVPARTARARTQRMIRPSAAFFRADDP